MSGLWWALIFGVAYPLIALAVACLGTFGISATKADRIAKARAQQEYPNSDADGFWFRHAYGPLIWQAVALTCVMALFWPVGVPLYLAWKKGSFINDALVQRAELAKQHSP